MQHYKTEIQKDHENLSELVLQHIENCPSCRNELLLMQGISNSLASLPKVLVPQALRARVFAKIFQPAYNLWQTSITALVLLFSPLIVKFSSNFSNFYLDPVYFYSISIFFAIVGTALLVPLTLGVYNQHTEWFDKLERSIVNHLQS